MEMTKETKGHDIPCPYCGEMAVFMTSKDYYGKDYGTNLYTCKPCDARIGTHQRTANPLGTMAKPELRALRMQAHKLFDPLWKPNHKGDGRSRMSRKEAYTWLRDTLGLDKKDAHIGKFNEEQCERLIAVLKILREEKK